MTRPFFKLSAACLLGAALGVVAWSSHTLQTQIALYQLQLGFATSGAKAPQSPPLYASYDVPETGLPTKYIQIHRTAAAMHTQQMLQKVVAIPFVEETPFSEVLKFIKRAAEESSPGSALSLYLDPVGLFEADRTEESSVKLAIEGLNLEDSLHLICDQLGLSVEIRDNGLVYIDNKDSDKPTVESFPETVLDQLSILQVEVQAMRRELGSLRTGQPLGSSGGGMSSRGGCNFY